jgi:hypothetical protein
MDTNKLRNHVFEQTGIRIDTTDPVFALVALNDAVLAEGVERQRVLAAEMSEQLATRTKVMLDAADRFRQEILDGAQEAPPQRSVMSRVLSGIGVAVLAALLTLTGQALLLRPEPPQRIAVPTPLTAEQTLNMRNGEKLMKILPKLDAPAQAQVKELMDAPLAAP